MNWFVALKGKVTTVTPGDGINMAIATAYQAYRDAHGGVGTVVWLASSPHVLGLAGFGLTPDEAIRAFEERMSLPATATSGGGAA